MSFVESTGDGMFRVYVQLSAGRRPGTKTDEVRGIVEGVPFNMRGLTLDIDVGFSVDDYPEELENHYYDLRRHPVENVPSLVGLVRTKKFGFLTRPTVQC